MELYELLLWRYGTKAPTEFHRGLSCIWSLPQTLAEASAAPKSDYSWISTWVCSCKVLEHFASLQRGLAASASAQKHCCSWPECLGGLRISSGLIYILRINLVCNGLTLKWFMAGKTTIDCQKLQAALDMVPQVGRNWMENRIDNPD